MQKGDSRIAAILVHTDLSVEIVHLLKTILEQNGFAPIRVEHTLPTILPQPCLLVLDEQIGGIDVDDLLPSLSGTRPALCVLVSAPYSEKIDRLMYDPARVVHSDMVVIKGTPERPSELDMTITATSEPSAMAALCRRIAKSLLEEEANLSGG